MKITSVALALIWMSTSVAASELSVSLAELPGLAAQEPGGGVSGSLPKLIAIVDDHYPQADFALDVFPFARSIHNVSTGSADTHAPLINVGQVPNADFQYVNEPLLDVTFVIYSHKDAPVSDTSDFNALSVDTLIGHSQFFDFEIGEVKSLEIGLKKVAKKRIDALIMEQDAVDHLVKAMSMDVIHRAPYASWGSAMIVQKGPAGDKLNADLSAAIKKAKQDPRYAEASNAVHKPYDDWQP